MEKAVLFNDVVNSGGNNRYNSVLQFNSVELGVTQKFSKRVLLL